MFASATSLPAVPLAFNRDMDTQPGCKPGLTDQAYIAHELRTPLTAISGFTQLLRVSADAANNFTLKQCRYLEQVEQACEVLGVKIGQLLDQAPQRDSLNAAVPRVADIPKQKAQIERLAIGEPAAGRRNSATDPKHLLLALQRGSQDGPETSETSETRRILIGQPPSLGLPTWSEAADFALEVGQTHHAVVHESASHQLSLGLWPTSDLQRDAAAAVGARLHGSLA